MRMQKNDLFLKGTELPTNCPVAWAIINSQFEIKRVSEDFYRLADKPISILLNRHISSCFSSFDASNITLSDKDRAVSHWVDDKGRGLQGVFTPIPHKENLWSVILSEINLEDKWLMELHPDYHHAIQSSDEWLTQIEAVMLSKPEAVFQTAVEQAISLTYSKIGYLHLYNSKSKKLTLTAWSNSVLDVCSIPEKKHQDLNDAGIWADCIRKGEAVIHNNYELARSKTGLPEKHFELTRHMSVPIHYRNRIVGVIGVGNRDTPYTPVDAKSLSVFAAILWHSVELPRSMRVLSKQSQVIRSQREQLSYTLVQLIGAVSDAVELKDAYTAGHQKSVSQLAYLMGEKLGLKDQQLEGLKLGALIHDIGKLGVPGQILAKPSRLTKEEYELVKMHSQQGADIIDEVEFPWPIKEMILQHHERLDGSGYPRGLKGDQIILEAQIIGVADVADSVLSHRPYRPSLGIKKLTEILDSGKGTLFDPKIVEVCLDMLSGHEFSNVQYVSHIHLEPVVEVGLYNSIGEVRQLMSDCNAKVALVRDESAFKVVGVIDKTVLDYWHSPLLDTAAERTVDRNIENKRIHQVMSHSLPLVEGKTILKDAKYLMENGDHDFLIVMEEQTPLGCLTWRALANAHSYEVEDLSGH